MPLRSTMALLLLGLVGLSAGCESRFNQRNFALIRPGTDDREDVRLLLGEPAFQADDVWLYEDLDRHKYAQIFFDEHGRVRSKEWMDATTGTWDGENPWVDRPPPGEVRERQTRTRRIEDD